MRRIVIVLLLASALPAAARPPREEKKKPTAAVAPFAPVEIKVDVSALSTEEKQILGKLVATSKIMDALFLRQVWAGNEPLLLELVRDESPAGRARLHEFLIHKGPWNRLDHNKPFIAGAPPKPAEANFYPAGATKSELDAWLKTLSPADKERALGFYTTIRRAPDGKPAIVPYSIEYQGELARAAELLRQSAALAADPTLKKYLATRADAFLSNDYYKSDVAWMDLTSRIEPTVGPYEVYEDEWYNAKAAFESFIALRDDAETDKLSRFSAELQGIEDHLPIPAAMRNPKLGASAPIRVVNELYCAGDASHGVQTAAFNLPNDERIEKERGTKRVMLKNVQEAKFSTVLLPIARVALSAADGKDVAFDAFFTHILMHELMHGLGPHVITAVGGKTTTVRASLESAYSAIEEAKADISGLWAMQLLVDKGVLPKTFERTMYTTFLASAFRSIRFGVTEAHGKGQALQLNYLLDAGAVVVGKDGTFATVPGKIKDGVAALTRELLTLEGEGNGAHARELLAKLGVVRPPVQAVLDRLTGVPIDIEPRFVTAATLE